MIRGATQQILDESERSLHDALCVLQQTVKETRIVFGGGTCVHTIHCITVSVSFTSNCDVVQILLINNIVKMYKSYCTFN